jgi:hypothetical protein
VSHRLLNKPIGLLGPTLAIILATVAGVFGQPSVRDYRRAHERQILDEFTRLLAIPNVAADRDNIRRNAQFILEMMRRRGLNPRLLETKSKETPPAVYGEWKVPGATRSIVFYAHYDGQPTDPKQWTGTMPWQPVWRSGALESGGQIMAMPPRQRTVSLKLLSSKKFSDGVVRLHYEVEKRKPKKKKARK